MSDTLPADILRAAAKWLRAAAQDAHRASPAPWSVTDENVVRCADGMIVADRSGTDHPAERADLPYVAAMGPATGAAIVAVLEQAADALEGQDVPADEPVLVLARQLLEGGPR
ncbi:hypothetical protein ACPCDX_29000 [Streptomyces koyangensis]|uniref:hypothetical protein n=1 Tax=Streptomyces koyangensis TaxID=188770 RepID=UPI003C305A96